MYRIDNTFFQESGKSPSTIIRLITCCERSTSTSTPDRPTLLIKVRKLFSIGPKEFNLPPEKIRSKKFDY